MKKAEILAPAGTKESVIAAINGGCDAIYIGGKAFNARHYASNPSQNELKDIINICHLRGVKVFITLNILYKEKELNDVLNAVKEVYEYGADALIIQDIGMLSFVREHFPDIKISASTQMTVHSAEGVRLLKRLGADRVVLARELSLDEIIKINSLGDRPETEVFVHGALCVCYSGRCLMSSLIGRRSGNRGRCAQPCRMDYTLLRDGRPVKKGCLLSPKDISGLDILDRIALSGVDSLKIEGRMKDPEYVYETVSVYRKYIDLACPGDNYRPDNADREELTAVFNRGGALSQGYFESFSGSAMMSASPKHSGVEAGEVLSFDRRSGICRIRLHKSVSAGDGIEIWSEPHTGAGINVSAEAGSIISVRIKGSAKKGDRVFRSFDKALNDRLKRHCIRPERRLSVRIRAGIGLEKSFVEFLDYGIVYEGEGAEKALNHSLTSEEFTARLCKTGDTPFEFAVEGVSVEDGLYMPVSRLNMIRRSACEMLGRHIIEKSRRQSAYHRYEKTPREKAQKAVITALVSTAEQLRACIEAGIRRIYCPSGMADESTHIMCRERGIELYIALPHITRQGNAVFYEKYKSCDGYLVRSLGEMRCEKPVIADYSLNIMNSASADIMRSITGGNIVTLSPELNIPELNGTADKDCEIVIYGRLPLMTTHQCPAGLYDADKNSSKYCSLRGNDHAYALTDRTHRSFPVLRNCSECYALILNSEPIYVLGRAEELIKTGAGFMRLEFTDEDYKSCLELASEHINVIEKGLEPALDIKGTGGHFGRGVY